MSDVQTPDEKWARNLGYDEVHVHGSGKRCGVQWTPWMGDWFTSWSPRNYNSHAEGPWAHWVELALAILRDPMTEHIRPELRALVADAEPHDYYDSADRYLTYSELRARLESEVE
jgi:hypothetical protein